MFHWTSLEVVSIQNKWHQKQKIKKTQTFNFWWQLLKCFSLSHLFADKWFNSRTKHVHLELSKTTFVHRTYESCIISDVLTQTRCFIWFNSFDEIWITERVNRRTYVYIDKHMIYYIYMNFEVFRFFDHFKTIEMFATIRFCYF